MAAAGPCHLITVSLPITSGPRCVAAEMEEQPRSSGPAGPRPVAPQAPPPPGPAPGPGGPPAAAEQQELALWLEQQLARVVSDPSAEESVFDLLVPLLRLGQDLGVYVLHHRLVQCAAGAGHTAALEGLLGLIDSRPDRLAVAVDAARTACASSAEKRWEAAHFLLMEALRLAAERPVDHRGTISGLVQQLTDVQIELAEAAQHEREAAQREREAAQRELRDARRGRWRWAVAGAALGAGAALVLVALLGGHKGHQATTTAGRRSR